MKLNLFLVLAGAVALTAPAYGDVMYSIAPSTAYKVTLDTSGLTLQTPGDHWYLDWQLDGVDANTVNLSGIDLGGGTVNGSPSLTGNVTGSLAGGYALVDDSSYTNQVLLDVNLGSHVIFNFSFTSPNPMNGDSFTWAVEEGPNPGSVTPIVSAGLGSSLEAIFDGSNPLTLYASTADPAYGNVTPVVELARSTDMGGSAVPEPSTWGVAAVALAAMGLLFRRPKPATK